MCINRKWDYLNAYVVDEYGDIIEISLTTRRTEDKIPFRVTRQIKKGSSAKTIVMDIVRAVNELETYRNCECPKNKDCHVMVNNKLNIITSHGINNGNKQKQKVEIDL